MNTIFRFSAVTVKDLQVFFKDRVMVFTVFALPLIVSLIAGSPYLGGGEDVINLPMILVDLDPGKYSDDIVDILEDIASGFKGVEKSFAIQAGREIRILVKPEEIDDLGAMRLARDIVKKIEEGMQYPGQIKVTVLRETRAVDYAK